MGKNLQQGNTEIIGKNRSSPGCMWGVLHILKYHHWRSVKRRLPHKRGASNKDDIGDGIAGNDTNVLNTDKIPVPQSNGNSSVVNDKTALPAPVSKSSVKSRLKALLTEELYRRKGKHRRTDSCPIRSPVGQKESINQLQPSNGVTSKDANPTVSDSKSSLSDPPLPNTSEVKNSDETGNHLEHNQVDENAKHDLILENSDSEKQNVAQPEEFNVDASARKSKEASDALDMINMNKDFLLKILQDPGSPLANLFHNQQALSRKKNYSKSQSFSVPSHLRGSGSRKHKPVQEGMNSDDVKAQSMEYVRSKSMSSIAAEYRLDGILKLNQAISESVDPSTSSSVPRKKSKCFEDIKHKIKNAIRNSKKEKKRITMDGILHKVPHGHDFPNDLKTHPPISRDNESDHSLPCNTKNELPCFRRTSSLRESVDRYCQLYESSFNRESKPPCPETSKSRTKDATAPQNNAFKSMRRMFSSPNLKSDFSEYSSDPISSSQIRIAVDTTMSTTDNVSEQLEESESEVKSEIQQNIPSETNSVNEDQVGMTIESNIDPDAKLDLVSEDLDNLVMRDEESQEQDVGSPKSSATELEEPSNTLVFDFKYQEETPKLESLSITEEMECAEVDPEMMLSPLLPIIIDAFEDQEVETISKDTPIAEKHKFPSNNQKFRGVAKEKAEYDYVRDILKLSGFSGTELLGTWHSNDKPMDPGLFEEMEEGCMVLDPECSGNVEGYHCHHLMLFDLINEVLMEIYAKSYTYCPMPLSALSHIRPMPVGSYILEEVWANISWYLNSIPEGDQLLDYVVGRDLAKSDGWMNLQFDSECIGLEVEDLIFDDLLDEIIFT